MVACIGRKVLNKEKVLISRHSIPPLQYCIAIIFLSILIKNRLIFYSF